MVRICSSVTIVLVSYCLVIFLEKEEGGLRPPHTPAYVFEGVFNKQYHLIWKEECGLF